MKLQTTLKHACSIATAAVGIHVATGPAAHADTFGFGFQLGNSATATVDATSEYTGVRFTALDSITIDTLGFGLNNGSGAVAFALQADDGFGNPTGVDLAFGNATAGAGYTTATVAPTALTAGNVYHIIIRPQEGSSAGLRVALGGIGTVSDIHTRDGTPHPNAAQIFTSNNGSTWTVSSHDSRANVWGVANSSTG